MVTVADRKRIAKLVLTTPDTGVLEKIKLLISPRKKAQENAIKKYNKEIDEAVKQIRAGKYLSQDEADALLTVWEKK